MNASSPSPSSPFQPYGLVSLWDMLEFGAANFIRVITAHSGIYGLIRNFPTHADNEKVPQEIDLESVQKELVKLKKYAEDLECKGAVPPIDRFIKAIDSADGITFGVLKSHFEQCISRVPDELEGRLFLAISNSDIELYQQTRQPFGTEVGDKFPLSIEDISEAAKCIALGRYTASVFHLMRAMEAAVIKLGEKLRVTVIDLHSRNLEWGKIIGNISDKLKTMSPGDDKNKLSEVVSLLSHVKLAWRNTTMHPKQTYSEEEAKAIFGAVRAFMQNLASFV